MKIGHIEGTPEEINGFFEDNDLDIDDYIARPDKALSKKWIIIPAIMLLVCAALLTMSEQLTAGMKNFLFLLGFGCCAWGAASVQIRFKSIWAAGTVLLTGVLIMLVALGVLSPDELLKYYEKS